MKKLKLLLAFIIILMTSFPFALPGQKKLPDLSEASWRKADFIGLLDGVAAYNMYYHKDLKTIDSIDNKSVIINVILVYTPHGLKHRDELAITATTIAMEYLIGVDVSHERCFIYKYTSYSKDGDNYSHQNISFGLIYPDSGTVEEYYISLAKKLVKEK